jgi:hypothetical protein
MFAFVIGCIGVYFAFEIICGILAVIAVATNRDN